VIKASKVVFVSQELEDNFKSLKEDDPIKKAMIRAIKDLKENAFSGIQIPKRLFPQEYVQKWGITNLWKYDLPRGWRLLYTVTTDNEVELISAILEWFDHKEYERRFRY
jgi:Txe/YoeB family toxin of Txe-Axe toxin-antitoxin module